MPVINLAEFVGQVEKESRRLAPAEVNVVARKIGIEALSGVVVSTPVDTGRARGNWQIGINTVPSTEIERLDPSGSGAISDGVARMAVLPDFPRIEIANNVPYIERLEDGHSKQAPSGMVKTTAARLAARYGA